MAYLVSSSNRDGYHSALQNAWEAEGLNIYETPAKSSLSEFRQKVSFEFFVEAYESDLKRFRPVRRMLKGFYVYAVDGSDLDLPASDAVLSSGYRGFPFSKEMETHYPKMYVVKAFDVFNEIVVKFGFSTRGIEKQMGLGLIKDFEPNSIAIYDRMYCGHPTFLEHKKAGNHFLVRSRDCGKKLSRFVQAFINSGKKEMETLWYEKLTYKGPSEGIPVRLVKIKNPRTKKYSVFVTSLPKELFTRQEIGELYKKRWEVETSFRDLVTTLKMDQWHSKSINGILQEIYTLLWLTNAVKMQMNQMVGSEEHLSRRYKRPNFKLCYLLVVKNLRRLVTHRIGPLLDLLELYIRRTNEKRTHFSRSYDRVVRCYGTGFNVANKVSRSSRAS